METEDKITTSKTQAPMNPYFIPVAIVIAGIVIAGAVMYSSTNKSASKTAKPDDTINDNSGEPQKVNISVNTKGWSVLGSENAPVTLVEYADYVCPFCHRFWQDTFPSIKKDYIDTGKVKFIFKDFPVVGGEKAAEASRCAEEQGKFWEYHDLLFGDQTTESADVQKWQDPETHKKYAQQLGLDANALVTCFNEGRYKSKVQEGTTEAMQNGGQGTPFFIVDETPISGAQPYSVFQAAIEAELAK